MRIEELVSMDTQGEFRSDVQLSDYEDPKLNRELLQKYIFTVHAPATIGAAQRDYAAKDVLDALKTAFTVERGDYRIVLTANYGRGKSHLALALANFFARPADSPEVRIVLNRLEQALDNAAQLAGYRDFKQSKGEFLVVRLQGDRCDDLQEGFMRALEQTLQEHSATRGLEMPFWYVHAEAWLKNLSGEARQMAESFLATQNTDLAHLTSGLRKQGAYALVREVFRHVTGAYPDFGREVNLEDLVLWAVDQVCVPHHLGGLLILFDEFSLFLQKYITARTVGKLQELLNGISKRPGKSAFLAFSQQDVDTVAETYAQGQRREDVKKELERLPKDKRVRLFSLMEAVLAAYLKQDEATWSVWREHQRIVKGTLVQACECTLRYFGKHYTTELKWDTGAFEQRVVKGCFPLHPLTTAILSLHNFEAGAAENPRTALQFVRRMWEDLRQQPAQLPDGRPNFVFAIDLVDFFGEQISKTWYAAYRNALESSPIPLTNEHRTALKALLLQQAVDELNNLKLRRDAQLELLSHLCGLTSERLKDLLRELSEAQVIQYDPYNKVSSLLPSGVRSPETEKIIKKAVDETPVDRALLDKIGVEIPDLEMSLGFGHISDWSPCQAVFTADMLTSQEIRKLVQPYRVGLNGIEEGPRGVVIWLIAQSEEERMQLPQAVQSVLDSTLGTVSHPLPVVIVLPKRPTPDLVTSARRCKALETLGPSEREKIGTLIYQQEVNLARAKLERAMDEWVGGMGNFADIPRHVSDYVLPNVYRASVQTLKSLSLKNVVTECYRQAYAYRVEFYTQYQIGGKGPNKLREAVREVVHWLMSDTAANSIRNLGNKDIKHQLSTFYLMSKWGLLAADTCVIQRPTQRALQEAWDMLEEAFSAGCNNVRAQAVLLKLLNPPYGHDYNTLTLLLAAWIGYHQYEICLSLNGRMVSVGRLKEILDESKNPQDFLNRLCVSSPLAISRIKPDEIFAQANDVLEKIRQGGPFTIIQAQETLDKLERTQAHPRLPETKREEIEQLRPRLEDALQKAQTYDRQVSEWLAKLDTADFDTLLSLRNITNTLPVVSLVSTNQPTTQELQHRWETAIQAALEVFCSRYTHLDSLTDYSAYEARLKHARNALKEYSTLAQRVDLAFEKLARRRTELQQQESEKAVIAEIRSMTPSAGLVVLYKYRDRLATLTNLSPQTAQLRDEKSSQIEGRIQQYEQFAKDLHAAVEKAIQRGELLRLRDDLLRNLDQVQETPLHSFLLEAKQKIERLQAFFERLRTLDTLPYRTPDELTTLETKLTDIETQYAILLSPAQAALLEQKKQEIVDLRRREIQKAQDWLTDLSRRYQNGENPETLLCLLENPPAFLPKERLTQLEAIRRELEKKRDKDVLSRIENLFKSIHDLEARRQCLKRLHELMGE